MTDSALDTDREIVAACRAVLDTRLAAEEAKAAKDQAIIALWRAGVPKTKVAEYVREALTREGFEPEEIAALGVSKWSVRDKLDHAPR